MTGAARGQKIDTVFVLMIFCVFALSVLLVLILAASIYQNITEISRDGQDERVALSYIWTKVKNTDDAGSIHINEFHGVIALCIDEDIEGIIYRTAIYHFNGSVHELFSELSLNLYPEDGIRIAPAPYLAFEGLDNGLIEITAGASRLLISPRSGLHSVEPDRVLSGGVRP